MWRTDPGSYLRSNPLLKSLRMSFIALCGLMVVLFAATYQIATTPAGASESETIVVAHAEPVLSAAPEADAKTRRQNLAELAQTEPWRLAQLGQEFYAKHIEGYEATFKKRERINGKLRKEETIHTLYREAPTSVLMRWVENADQVKRALYVDSPEFVNNKGEKLAKIEPAGAIIRLVVSEVEIPIHGERAKKTSRRSIDEFGFKSTLHLLNTYNARAEAEGVLDLRYTGTGEIDGRPTFIIERTLPYTDGSAWPDAKMVMHLDQQWLQPLAVYSYADHEGTQLLGSYVFEDVKLNPQFSSDPFKF